MDTGMSGTERTPRNGGSISPTPISLADRFVGSERFRSLYRDGMALVEETANYLDGEGREEARLLRGRASVAYASESMRLTTRLMQLASWLLVQRSVNDGRMAHERARIERRKINLEVIGRPSHVAEWDELPVRLRRLVNESFALHGEIAKLDRLIQGRPVEQGAVAAEAVAAGNPVGAQIIRLESAFGALRHKTANA